MRAWLIIEKVGEDFKVLAGTEDRHAINKALAALKLHKDQKIRDGAVDLTEIRSTVVEELERQMVDEVLESHDENKIDALLSMVED